MARKETFDFGEIGELFEDGNVSGLTDEEVLEVVAKPEILEQLSRKEQVIFVAKMFIKLTNSTELKERANAIIKEKTQKNSK